MTHSSPAPQFEVNTRPTSGKEAYPTSPLLDYFRHIDLTTTPACIIVGSLPLSDSEQISVRSRDMVIAADGGAQSLLEREIVPDSIIGDFDSASASSSEIVEKMRAVNLEKCQKMELIKLPVDKDDTDLTDAVRLGWLKGYRYFLIYGSLGGRWDLTLLNLNLLTHISLNGGLGVLISERQKITSMNNGELTLRSPELIDLDAHESAVGIIPTSDVVEDVSITGLLYEAQHVDSGYDEPLWSSNRFRTRAENIRSGLPVGPQTARMSIGQGSAHVVVPSDVQLVSLATRRSDNESLGQAYQGITAHLSVAGLSEDAQRNQAKQL